MSPRVGKWSRGSLVIVVLAIAAGVWFQQVGLQTFLDLRASIDQERALQAEVDRLEAENAALDAEIQSLQTQGWEKLARERLGMAKPGEYVVKIPGKK